MDTQEKLEILADASRFDLSCACGTKNDDRRQRAGDGLWLYPVSLPRGGKSIMLKTLMSNACVNDCRYCPFRAERDIPRCALEPEEAARIFIEYRRRLNIFGLFLSSAVVRDPDHTMDRLTAVARILRKKYRFRGYLHLKVIPGASDAAIEEALALSSAVSLNIEAPKRSVFSPLSEKKDYDRDIIRPLKRISELTARGMPYSRVKQSTQFIVGASNEIDSDIVRTTFRLYRRLKLHRVYFSAYQRGLGDPGLPGERNAPRRNQSAQGEPRRPDELLTREHRLYQTDWLMRKYGFSADEIPFEPDGNLSLSADPKDIWARRHPEFFPLDLNKAPRKDLLRIPGLGPVTVKFILKSRREGVRFRSLEKLGKPGKRLKKAEPYIKFGF